jgi:tryptophan 2,3-dioxygenase
MHKIEGAPKRRRSLVNAKPTSLADVRSWLGRPDADTFPLTAVIAELRHVGKHFVARELLEILADARNVLPKSAEALRRFLDTALDKHDGRFDNPTYLALHDLPLPTTALACPLDTRSAEQQHDRLIMLLVADILRFEIVAREGSTNLLSLMRPGERTVAKRCALGLRVLRPVMARLGIDAECDRDDPIEAARHLLTRSGQSADEERMLAVTLLTVSTVHDENLFVRVLQCYETAFSLVVVQLRAAIVALSIRDGARATRALRTAVRAMDDASPFFSLLATMQVEAFMTFREYTDGASAIQSRSYKSIESLCRRPDPARLAGPGYDAVPDVRARVLAGQPTLGDALAQSALSSRDLAEIGPAMADLEAQVLGWRRTHHNLAMRMLGMRRGTGDTAGVPYLAETREIPLFKCPFAATAPRGSQAASGSAP